MKPDRARQQPLSLCRAAWSLVTLLPLVLGGCGDDRNAYEPPPPPQVTVARPVAASVPVFLEENGTTEAVAEAEVRARVRGFIEEICFQPADPVGPGDPLYRIEPDQYQSAVQAAEAQLDSAEAAIATAKAKVSEAQASLTRAISEYTRWKALYDDNAGSESELQAALEARDASQAALQAAEASVQVAEADKRQAEAAVTDARLDLDYTTVIAPIDGFISKTNIKLGNLVQDGELLARIVGRDPIYVNFSVPDRVLLRFADEVRAAAGVSREQKLNQEDWRSVEVFVGRLIDDGFPFRGTLDYVDTTGVDPTTGTLGLRAIVDNPDGRLVPGLFVRVRMPAERESRGLLIPESSIGRDQLGSFVLTVNEESKVQRSNIKIARRVEGWVVIEAGLDAESRVVVEGLQRAIPGLPVDPELVSLEVDPQQLVRGSMESAAASAEPAAEEDPETGVEPEAAPAGGA
jgi:RND family efflux transporter MFP subunit